MGIGKGAYLKKITNNQRWKSIELGEKIDGSSPPSVFIGSFGYPKVTVGPMMTELDESSIMDSPETWIPQGKKQEEIIDFRMALVRGKHVVDIYNTNDKIVSKLQEISLAKESVLSEAEFFHKPRGFMFDSENTPHGPSAKLDKFEISNVKWDQLLEKAFYDTDWLSKDAVVDLYENNIAISSLQKALSTATMGVKRKLVPTRWSITAIDSILANHIYDEVRYFELIENFQVFEFSSLNNYYVVLLIPTPWQYEWIEAFIKILGNEEMIFADMERWKPKKSYSTVGGCYYSAKFGVLEGLKKMKKQAGAIVLREAYPGYIPLGVFNVRENIRNAMKEKPMEFENFRSSLNYVSTKLRLPISRFIDQGALIKEVLFSNQKTLGDY